MKTHPIQLTPDKFLLEVGDEGIWLSPKFGFHSVDVKTTV